MEKTSDPGREVCMKVQHEVYMGCSMYMEVQHE